MRFHVDDCKRVSESIAEAVGQTEINNVQKIEVCLYSAITKHFLLTRFAESGIIPNSVATFFLGFILGEHNTFLNEADRETFFEMYPERVKEYATVLMSKGEDVPSEIGMVFCNVIPGVEDNGTRYKISLIIGLLFGVTSTHFSSLIKEIAEKFEIA
jgi:hypothetical protein